MNAILLSIGAGLCWGVGELFTRSALHSKQIGPLAAISIRSTIALPLLWLAYLLATRGMGVEKSGWLFSIALAFISVVVVVWLFGRVLGMPLPRGPWGW